MPIEKTEITKVRIKPATAKEMSGELWDVVIGTNGEGLVSITREQGKDIGEMKTDVAHIRGSVEGFHSADRPAVKIITLKKLLEGFLGTLAVALVLGGLILLLTNKITMDDVIRILEARAAG